MADLEGAKTELGKDETKAKTSHNWQDFIKHLDADLKDPALAQQQDKLKQEAQRLLKDAGFGDVTIDGVKDGKILEHKDGKARQIDAKGQEADLTTAPTDVNQRDDKSRVETNASGNAYEYDDKDNSLKKVSWPDANDSSKTHSWEKKDGKWQDETGTEVKFTKEPTVDQKTGDLSFQQDGQKLTIDKAAGGFVTMNDDGTVDNVVDKNGNTRQAQYDKGQLVGVDYTANGATHVDPKQSWIKKGDHWENKETTPKTAKDIQIDPKTGDYTEVSADGSKKHVYHADGTDAEAANAPDKPPPPVRKGSLHEQWVEARKQARIDSENDVNTTGKHTIKFGDTMWDVAKASAKKNSDDHHDPTNSEIASEVVRLKAKYDKAHPGQEIQNINSVPIGTEIDTTPDKAPEPPPSKTNDVKGDKGQTVHYAPEDTKHEHPIGVDYPNGMKSQINPANGNVDVTGDPANGGKEYKLIKQPDGTWQRQDAGGNPVDPPQDYKDVTVNDDGSMKLTNKDGTLITSVGADGKSTSVHYDGKGTDKANVTGVDYPNGMKTQVAANGDVTVSGDPNGGDNKDYKLVKQADNTYKKMKSDGTTEVDPPQVYSGVDIDPGDGSMTLTTKDNIHKTTVHADGTTTDVQYDGKGTEAGNVREVDYPNGVKAKISENGDVDVTDPSNGGSEYKLVKQADNTYKKMKADGTTEFDPPQTYSKVEVDPDDGSITLTGKVGGKDHTTTLNSDGTTTEADVEAPPPPQPTADKAVVKADPADNTKINEVDYVNGTVATVQRDSDGSIKEMDFTANGSTSKIVKNGDHYELQPPPKGKEDVKWAQPAIDPDTGKVVITGSKPDGSKVFFIVGPDGKLSDGNGDPPA